VSPQEITSETLDQLWVHDTDATVVTIRLTAAGWAGVGDGVAFQAAGVVEVEFLQRLSGREACRADASFTALGLAGGDFALQTCRQVFLVGPVLHPCPLSKPCDGITHGGAFNARVR